jgi:type IV pilus assembly protein PilE
MGHHMRHRNLGVTLVELLVVLVIIGILSAIAYPTYRKSVLRANRTEAKAAMMQLSQALEKCFTRFGAYNNANCTAFTSLGDEGRLTETGKYRLSFADIDDVTFTIRAAPEGGQAADTVCGNLQIDQSGRRESGAPDPKTCW